MLRNPMLVGEAAQEARLAFKADGATAAAAIDDDPSVMLYLRSIVFNVVFYATFFVISILGVPLLALPRSGAVFLVKFWAHLSVGLLRVICGTKIEFRNLELLPKGASILAVKHQSFLETFALITVLDDFSYILKKELAALPFFGWYVKATDQISLDRDKKGAAVPLLQKHVREKLAAGRQIVIFPEGTRRPVGAPPLYKSGVAALCATANIPCTPVALNTGLFWPRHSILRRPGTVVIEFLPPFGPIPDKVDFMKALQAAIEPASNALVAEAMAGDPGLDKTVIKRSAATA